MANFKTHIGWGVVIAAASIIFSLIYSIFSGMEAMALVFSAVLVGSFLPDLDLDEGVPFQILFGLLGLGAAAAVFLKSYQEGMRDFPSLIIFPVLALGAIRFILGYIFKRFTSHRGIFHSLPAAVLSGLATFWILKHFSLYDENQVFISLAVSVGYLGHLVLDEIYSSVNLHGGSFLPKQSLGSALKLHSSSKITTLCIYVSIAFLAVYL